MGKPVAQEFIELWKKESWIWDYWQILYILGNKGNYDITNSSEQYKRCLKASPHIDQAEGCGAHLGEKKTSNEPAKSTP
jgi:hypothetical protein